MTLKPHPQPLTVAGLIERLKGFHPERKVYVRYQDPLGESDYWAHKEGFCYAKCNQQTEQEIRDKVIDDERRT